MRADTRSADRTEVLLAAAVFLVLLAGSLALVRGCGYALPDAVIRHGIARSLLSGVETGRHALVCSLDRPALATMLHLPFVRMRGCAGATLAACIISCLSAALTMFLLGSAMRQTGLHRLMAWTLAAGMLVHPWYAPAAAGGVFFIVFLLFWTAFLCSWRLWLEGFRTRYLVGMSLSTGGMVLILPPGFLMAGILAVFLAILLASCRRARPAEYEGTLIVLLLPAGYGMLVWALFSRLITEDALFFLKSTVWSTAAVVDTAGPAALLKDIPRTCPLLAAAAAGLLAAGVLLRDRQRLCVASAAVPAVLFLLARNYLPSPAPAEMCLVLLPLSLLLAADLVLLSSERGRMLTAALLAGLSLGLFLSPAYLGMKGEPTFPEGRRRPAWEQVTAYALGQTGPRQQAIREMLYLLESCQEDRKILLVGFWGYNILEQSSRRDLYLHTMEPNLARALEDTRGKNLYVLVPDPSSLGPGWEPLFQAYPRMYQEGSREAILWETYGTWRLFRIARAR